MAIELDNEHFQELKELPDFQKRFSVLYLTLDNSEQSLKRLEAARNIRLNIM